MKLVKGKNYFNTNQYSRLEVVYSLDNLLASPDFDLFNYVGSNQDLAMPDFISKLEEYESKYNYASCKREANVRYGVTLKVLLDKAYSVEDLMKLANSIIKKYDNLPFYAFESCVGEAHFLNMYICERHYYKDGIVYEKVAKKAKYRNKLTGRMCKATDENAVCVYKEGDIISKEVVYFSLKETYFKYANVEAFNYFMNRLKERIVKLLNKLFGVEIEEGFSFRKFSVSKQTTAFRKLKAKLWNKTFDEAVLKLNNALEGLTYMYDPLTEKKEYYKAKEELISLFDNWNDRNATNGTCNSPKKNAELGINLNYKSLEILNYRRNDYLLYLDDAIAVVMSRIKKETGFAI